MSGTADTSGTDPDRSGAGMTAVHDDVDARALRDAFGRFPSGVIALCAYVDGAPIGMAASAFTCVSLRPPLVAICIARTSTTWPQLRTQQPLGLSVLSSEHDELCRKLSGPGDRFVGVDWTLTDGGAVVLGGATLWLECVLHEVFEAGDHEIALLRIASLRADPEISPLVFHGSRFHRLEPLQVNEVL